MINFRPVEDEHVEDLEKNVQLDQILEVYASHDMSIKEAVLFSLSRSFEKYSLFDDDELLGIVGVVPYTTLADTACPWLITTYAMDKRPKSFIKYTRSLLNIWSDNWPFLVNHVDARYTKAVRWAGHVGFTVYDPEPYGPYDKLFHRIELRRV